MRVKAFSFDAVDLVGGLLLIVAGGAVSVVSFAEYPLGTLRRMGPGAFPFGLGLLLAAFGLMIAVKAMVRHGEKPDIRVFSPFFVLASVAAFALTITQFGLIPAIVAVTVVSSIAELEFRPLRLAALCLALCLLAPFVFVICLGLPIPVLRWPF